MTINEKELFAYSVYVVELKSGAFESTLMAVVSSWLATYVWVNSKSDHPPPPPPGKPPGIGLF